MLHAITGQRIHHRIDERRRAANRARFTRALHAKRIGLTRDFDEIHINIRQVIGARQRVIHEGCRQKLAAFRIKGSAFQHGLANALRHTPMHLAAHDQRVQRMADIINHHIIRNLDDAGIGVHLNLCRMAAIGEGVGFDLRHFQRIQKRHFLALSGTRLLRCCQFQNANALIGADNAKTAIGSGEFNIGDRRFQMLGSCLLALFNNRCRRDQNGLAFGIKAARAARATARRQAFGIALLHTDFFDRDAQFMAGQHGIGGFMPLPGALRADINIHEAIIGEAHRGVFGRVTAGRFQVIGEANAAPFAAPLAFRPPCGEAGPVQPFQRRIHELRELAGIIALPHGRDVRHGGRRHHVPLADRNTIHAHFLSGGINQALHQIITLGAASTTIRIHRHGIGDHANNIGVDGAEIINTRQHLGARTCRDEGREGVQISAHIRPILGAQRKELAILIQRQFASSDIVPPMRI